MRWSRLEVQRWLWPLTLVGGFLPPHCGSLPGGGGSGGNGSGAAAGEASAGAAGEASGGAAGDSSGGAAGDANAGAGGDANGGVAGDGDGAGGDVNGGAGGAGGGISGGAGGGANEPLIVEPLLGCTGAAPDRPAAGSFELVPSFPVSEALSLPFAVSGLSGNGEYVTGSAWVVDEETLRWSVWLLRWSPAEGFFAITPEPLEGWQSPTTSASCSGDAVAGLLPSRGVYFWANGEFVSSSEEGKTYSSPSITDDGLAAVYNTSFEASPYFIYPQVWVIDPDSNAAGDASYYRNYPISDANFDGSVIYGDGSYCAEGSECVPARFRFTSETQHVYLLGLPWDAIPSSDGSVFVSGTAEGELQFWNEFLPTDLPWAEVAQQESVACPAAPCSALAVSSGGQVVLLQAGTDSFIWTEPHGFRSLDSLIPPHAGWTLQPLWLSLDGYVVAGTATDASGATSAFRAVLRRDAFD